MEKRNVILLLFGMLFVFGIANVIAQENVSDNSSLMVVSQSPVANVSNSSLNVSQPVLILKEIIPSNFKVGDVQFNMKFENTGSSLISNIAPIVTGNGFSVSNLIPLDKLASGEDDYVIVMGNFRNAGLITLNIKNGDMMFNYNVTVSGDSNQAVNNTALISNLTAELEELKQKYSTLDYSVNKKKEDGFEVSGIKLDDAKKYLRSAEAELLGNDAETAQVNLKLALEEIEDQTLKIDSAKAISSVDKLKNNAVIFSTIAGAMIALFTLYELLKKKGSVAVDKVKEVKEKIGKKD